MNAISPVYTTLTTVPPNVSVPTAKPPGPGTPSIQSIQVTGAAERPVNVAKTSAAMIATRMTPLCVLAGMCISLPKGLRV